MQHHTGVPKESLEGERRVALSPTSAAALLKAGFGRVCVQASAGSAAQFTVRQTTQASSTC